MKNIIVILFLSLPALVDAQTFSEWFKQKRTQKKYLLEQIAALQAYIGHARKGYDIAKEGLGIIGRIERSNLDLHTVNFGSLKNVSPSIKHSPGVASIMDLQDRIMKTYIKTSGKVSTGHAFTPKEKIYVKGVLDRLLGDCDRILSEMLDVLVDGKLTMTDDERIQRIGQLQGEMQSDYLFIQTFSKGTLILAASRTRDQLGLEKARGIHGIKK